MVSYHQSGKAQKVFDTVVAKVYYKAYHMYDTIGKISKNENMILFVGKNSSVYKSMDKIYNDSLIKDNGPKMQTMDFATNGTRKATFTQIAKSTNNPNKLLICENLFRDYLITEDIQGAMDWQIGSDTKKIENLDATKATCFFKGRNYEAWFCTDIPIPNGPWKFGRLPGLILEVTDITGFVKFNFAGFENVQNKNELMPELPLKAIKISKQDFSNLKEAFRNDPETFMNNAFSDLGNGISNVKINTGLPNNRVPNRNNNPIEIEAK